MANVRTAQFKEELGKLTKSEIVSEAKLVLFVFRGKLDGKQHSNVVAHIGFPTPAKFQPVAENELKIRFEFLAFRFVISKNIFPKEKAAMWLTPDMVIDIYICMYIYIYIYIYIIIIYMFMFSLLMPGLLGCPSKDALLQGKTGVAGFGMYTFVERFLYLCDTCINMQIYVI